MRPDRRPGFLLSACRSAHDALLDRAHAPPVGPDGRLAHPAACHLDHAGAVGRELIVIDHAFGDVAHDHLGDVINRFAPPIEADAHAFGIEPGGGNDMRAAAPAHLGEQLGMTADIGRRQINHGLDAVITDHRVDRAGDRVGDGLQIPDIVMVELATLIGIADMLMGQRDPGLIGRDVAEHSSYDGHHETSWIGSLS